MYMQKSNFNCKLQKTCIMYRVNTEETLFINKKFKQILGTQKSLFIYLY